MIIEMSEKQMNVMREALEFYSRFLSGQLEMLPDELKFPVNRRGDSEKLSSALQKVKEILFPELRWNESYSVGRGEECLNDLRAVSYEMYREIYVYQAMKRKLNGDDVSMNVYSSPTMKYSGEKLIEISEPK